MRGFVYLLVSKKDGRTYIGSTDNLDWRLAEHLSGKVTSTKNRRPLEVIYKETFKSLTKAREREKYFKSRVGRRELKEIIKGIAR